jgi:hypothetical protein
VACIALQWPLFKKWLGGSLVLIISGFIIIGADIGRWDERVLL